MLLSDQCQQQGLFDPFLADDVLVESIADGVERRPYVAIQPALMWIVSLNSDSAIPRHLSV